MSKKADKRIKNLKTKADKNSLAIHEMKEMSRTWDRVYIYGLMRNRK